MNADLHEVLWLNTNFVYLFLFDIVLRQFCYCLNWVNVQLFKTYNRVLLYKLPVSQPLKNNPVNGIKNIYLKVKVSP
jgi:hypothetical protein